MTKKMFQKGHTKAPHVACGEKEKCCTSRNSTEPEGSQMLLHLFLEIASKNPQTTAEPIALFRSCSPPPDRPLGED